MAVAPERPVTGGRRSAARLAAVQALYQVEMTDANVEDVVQEFLTCRLGQEIEGVKYAEADGRFFQELVESAAAMIEDLDPAIAEVLPADWPLDRIDPVLRAILRAGTFELVARADVPVRVVLGEYVDLAHAFFSDREPGFVNGILDRLARRFRPEGFAETRNGPS